MNPRTFVACAAVVALCPLLGGASCEGRSVANACDVLHGDVVVRNGEVVGTVRPVCDPPPQSHLLKAVIEVAVGDTWIEFGRAAVVAGIPDATGFDVEVRAECREGVYRVKVHVEGAGPTGSPFVFDDTGPEMPIALVQCAG